MIANAAPVIKPTPAPAPRIVTPKKEPAKTEPAKAATPKPTAKPATPKAETAKSTAKQEDNPAAKHPKRNWVQLATGDNVPALRQDYRNLARKNPDMFKGLSGWTAPWGKQRRMVVGPFETLAEAKAWDKKWRAAGGDSYVWQSEDGSVVEPLANALGISPDRHLGTIMTDKASYASFPELSRGRLHAETGGETREAAQYLPTRPATASSIR